MTEILWLLAGAAIAFALTLLWSRRRYRRAPSRTPRLYEVAGELKSFFKQTSHPKDLLSHSAFQEGCELLASDEYSATELVDHAAAGNQVIVAMAFEGLSRRSDVDEDVLEEVIDRFDENSNWAGYFALRVLHNHAREPVVVKVLREVDDSWDTRRGKEILTEFIRARKEAGETPRFDEFHSTDEDDIKFMESFLDDVDDELETQLLPAFRNWRGDPVKLDREFLKSFGRLLEPKEPGQRDAIAGNSVTRAVASIEKPLSASPARSVLLVGDGGVGKTTVLGELVERLLDEGWTVFQASGADVISGQIYVGSTEGRVRRLLESVRGVDKFLWLVPSFQDLAVFGRHMHNDVSVLDLILPAVENGEVRVIGELEPAALERVCQLRAGVPMAFEMVRLEATSREETCDLVRRWVERISPAEGGVPLLEPRLLEEAYQLSRHFLGEQANPGALFGLLRRARERQRADSKSGPTSISIDDLLSTLSQLTGLPLEILDERKALEMEAVRVFFEKRVLGQPEAVSCLVDRIALIKAALTDPTRPQGVFLFTGPTGTGKTEIAKTLAEFLFGSPERMIRLDMSEFQTWESFTRLLGTSDELGTRGALVNEIRKQPFSVILLDEFEKAAAEIWDVFLQVFDDGRLTDRQGIVADCRHTVIILTANVGAESLATGAIGFNASAAGKAGIDRALSDVFRQEFLNRIDQVVNFQPLNRAVMREVLQKELGLVLERRGLRNRQWAVEWDESALEFLLSRGFSATLGARPLKRAIERHLLSPLARTIVTHEYPEGDQFLFVRSKGATIEVEFVDPEAPEPGDSALVVDPGPAAKDLRVEPLALDARGEPSEVAFLAQLHEELRRTVEGESWKKRKDETLQAMSRPDFWSSAERFGILGEAEYRDRIEAGLGTAGALLNRLVGREPGGRKHYASHLVRRLAERLYLIRAAIEGVGAAEPQDAFLLVSGTRDSLADPLETDRFAVRLADMYRKWAAKRRMSLEVFEEREDSAKPYRFVAAVSGYGAFRLIDPEAGFHVLERQRDSQNPTRCRVRVAVAPQPESPLPRRLAPRLAQALECLGRVEENSEIVRRYREEPSPLVRDSVRGWRTGRLDQVLEGNFDLFV